MLNSHRILSISFAAMMAIAGISLSPQPGMTLQVSQNSSDLSWEKVGQELAARRRKEPPLISRGELCAVSPASKKESVTIWSTEPLLVWRGTAAQMELVNENGDPYWKRSIPSDIRSVTYAGKTLEPGQTYVLRLYTRRSAYALPQVTVRLQVLDRQSRDTIAADLKSLEASLKNKGASAETIALHRANYFISKQLLADAVKEMYSVNAPSNQLKAVLQELPKEICNGDAPKS